MKQKSSKYKHLRDVPVHGLARINVDADSPSVVDTTDAAPQVGDCATAPPSCEIASAADSFMKMPEQPPLFAEPFGQRLAAARVALGWSVTETASKLRLPVHIVHIIESDDYAKIGAVIYLRSYMTNYARLVGVPTAGIDGVVAQITIAPPQLVASGRISHSRYLFDRYSGAALYVVLTGVIFVPLVMFAMNMGSDVGARLLPLDSPGATTVTVPADADSAKSQSADGVASTTTQSLTGLSLASSTMPEGAGASADLPLMASFAPMSAPSRALAPPATAIAPATQSIAVTLSEASWVEIVDADGKRLEYGILPAGTTRTYASTGPLDVRIGNTTGARIEVNGQAQEIAPFNRGNVAHFRVFATGKGTISRID